MTCDRGYSNGRGCSAVQRLIYFDSETVKKVSLRSNCSRCVIGQARGITCLQPIWQPDHCLGSQHCLIASNWLTRTLKSIQIQNFLSFFRTAIISMAQSLLWLSSRSVVVKSIYMYFSAYGILHSKRQQMRIAKLKVWLLHDSTGKDVFVRLQCTQLIW